MAVTVPVTVFLHDIQTAHTDFLAQLGEKLPKLNVKSIAFVVNHQVKHDEFEMRWW